MNKTMPPKRPAVKGSPSRVSSTADHDDKSPDLPVTQEPFSPPDNGGSGQPSLPHSARCNRDSRGGGV
uniref:Uncharacterized protein n=1 Tax=Amphimedon queenslandica TaxID=400682 RepID=A0A1X7VQR7_AMPQE